MFDAIARLFATPQTSHLRDDPKLAVAALLVHLAQVDGTVDEAIRQVRAQKILLVVVGDGRNGEAAKSLASHADVASAVHNEKDDHILVTLRDGVTDGGYPEKIVANAPATEDGFFLVPKVVE